MLSLVTGANGFVGRALVQHLLANGDRVRAVIHPREQQSCGKGVRPLAAHSHLQVVAADVTDRDAVDAASDDIERVFHSAAMVHTWAPFEDYQRINVGGTRNVAEAAFLRGIQRFVHISTSDVLGVPEDGEILSEDSPLREWGEPYADSKIEAERWLWRFHRERGLPLSVVYPGWVYGPGDRAFFPSLARAIGDGSMTFWRKEVRLPWVYIDNLADACLHIADSREALGNGYLAYDGEEGPTLQEVCARIAAIIGEKPPNRHIPFRLAHGLARLLQSIWPGEPPLRSADVKAFGYDWKFTNEKLRALGWAPKVATDDGMMKAMEALGQ